MPGKRKNVHLTTIHNKQHDIFPHIQALTHHEERHTMKAPPVHAHANEHTPDNPEQ